ncbi:hypothetical protein Sm713_42350 [Streptomyces sp. TS71-3]|nr:hypothetical protein Sm713_42350 [Streptomyces sp. TS71-3]
MPARGTGIAPPNAGRRWTAPHCRETPPRTAVPAGGADPCGKRTHPRPPWEHLRLVNAPVS